MTDRATSRQPRGATPLRRALEAVERVVYRGGWAARAWARVPGATDVQLVEHVIRIPDRDFAPVRIAFASDLHLGPVTPRETVDRAFELVARSKPDVLAIGGDVVFLDLTEAIARELTDRLRALEVPTKVAVRGNHDLWTDHERLARAYAESGTALVVNGSLRLNDRVRLVCVDDVRDGLPDPRGAFEGGRDGDVTVLLSHNPDVLARSDLGRFDVLLAGHTHGGQIALPGGVPILTFTELRRHARGLTRFGDAHVITSNGVGAVDLPMRLFAPSEVVIVTVTPA